MELQPQKSFTVVRQLANHQDSSTYYVRAVIRQAYTDVILATLDLADKGGQRFKYDWQVPADPSGEGFYVSIVTSVYDDSGYTTKSGNYGDEENTYLVRDHLGARRGGFQLGGIGFGGNGGVDSRTVRRIFQEEFAKIPTPEPVDLSVIPTPKEYIMRWDEVLSAVSALKLTIESIKIPELDLTPALKRMDELQQALSEKEVTPETDLTPIIDLIKQNAESSTEESREVRDIINGVEEALPGIIEKSVDKVIKATTFKSEVAMTATEPVDDTEMDNGATLRPALRSQRPKVDIKKLAL